MALKMVIQGDSWSLLDDGVTVLTVKEPEDEKETVLSVSGSLRSDTVLYFKDELAALATMGADVVLDFSELKYISNACQQALLTTQQQMDSLNKGSLTLRNVPKEIYKEFERINLHELLMIE